MMKLFHTAVLILSGTGAVVAFTSPRASLVQQQQQQSDGIRTPSIILSILHSSPNPEEDFTIDQYSRCLSPYQEKQLIKAESSQYAVIDTRPQWQSTLLKPVKFVGRVAKKVGETVGAREETNNKPGSLILLRCGESEWTKSGRFTGWADPDLVREGVLEIEHAGR